MTLSLSEKQQIFTLKLAQLIQRANDLGYKTVLAEVYRPPEMAEYYASTGKGVKNSFHENKLAADLLLFYDGKYLTDTKDYETLGSWWVNQSTELYAFTWGGNFKSRKDGNHFSLGET